MKQNNDNILFNARGFMGDPKLRTCSAEAIGVYYFLLLQETPCKLSLSGTPYADQLKHHRTERGSLAVFADYLNEQAPTREPQQTLRGLQELYDRDIIIVTGDILYIRIEYDYVVHGSDKT